MASQYNSFRVHANERLTELASASGVFPVAPVAPLTPASFLLRLRRPASADAMIPDPLHRDTLADRRRKGERKIKGRGERRGSSLAVAQRDGQKVRSVGWSRWSRAAVVFTSSRFWECDHFSDFSPPADRDSPVPAWQLPGEYSRALRPGGWPEHSAHQNTKNLIRSCKRARRVVIIIHTTATIHTTS